MESTRRIVLVAPQGVVIRNVGTNEVRVLLQPQEHKSINITIMEKTINIIGKVVKVAAIVAAAWAFISAAAIITQALGQV